MFDKDRLEAVRKKREEWHKGALKRSLERFGIKENPKKFYTPLDVKSYDFLEKVGFPGEYPFTADVYAATPPGTGGDYLSGGALVRAANYTGYGAPEDT